MHDRLEIVVEVLHDHVHLVERGADHHFKDPHDVGVVEAEEHVGLPERGDWKPFFPVVARQLHLFYVFKVCIRSKYAWKVLHVLKSVYVLQV